MKEYRSFEEVDRDLKILKLQNEIEKEELKLNIKHVKREISPKVLLGNLSDLVKRKALEAKAMVEGAAKGFIEEYKDNNPPRVGADLRVEPIDNEMAGPVETEIIVEKVIIDAGTDEVNRDKPFNP
ncbi:DUF6327 family protein [Antarcticibacterium sp. 1MA-6-2]|uniref:DUF6327 family protein n=1 Tax=Antarcticibacterium sp. 1MA-6-2 TaxID=2908210 RepID=UPI001F2A35DB|nr:DUF6327 family protein [Antarcticibacterium sp. 1MA-6-2]UJH90206.1 DUF6327 family protein [Antarcticibacterium sp. 1MA-6-2]